MPAAAAHAVPAGGRAHGLVLGVAAALIGLAVYQSVAVASAGDDSGIVLPGSNSLVGELPSAPEPAVAPAAAATAVEVEIHWRARLRPLPPCVPCNLTEAGQAAGPAGIEWLAGSASMPLQRPRAGDSQLARLVLRGRPTLRLLKLGVDAAAELRLGGLVQVKGQVVDVQGRGIAGARIWAAGAETTTGDDGAFAVEAIGGDGVPIVAVAPETVAQTILLDARGDCTVRFVMQPAGQIRVRLVGTALPGEPAQIFVLPGNEPRTSAEAQYPFFLQAVDGGARVSDRGVATLGNLPLGARVRLRLVHPRGVAEEMPVVEARLRPTEISVMVERAAVVSGSIVSGGMPAARACVVSWPEADGDDLVRGPGAACALPPLAYCGRGAVAWSDDAGSYSIARSRRYAASRLSAIGKSRWAAEVVVKGTALDMEHDLEVPNGVAVVDAGCDARTRTTAPGRDAEVTPVLSLRAPSAGHYRVRVREHGGAARPDALWTGSAPFPIALRAPALADVLVRVHVGEATQVRTLRSLVIAGPQVLDLPDAPR